MSRLLDSEICSWEVAKELGVTRSEYQWIEDQLQRKPRFAEAGIFSSMLSEHCSYKSTKRFLKRFPTRGKRVLQGPGENAGVLEVAPGWAIAFKMESHNHPSFIEPYQGAATGVGGILRDVFTMGARPIALMDSLCLGDPQKDHTVFLLKGIVKGIGDYGNSVGVPTVAGQTFFHDCYNQNPLVNAFALGILQTEHLQKGYASGIGNRVVYVGAKTGRDGVHGATMSSKEFSSEQELDRPTVQVGDPFTEKLLLEATLEAIKGNLIIGIQDMGAAGLTSSSFEMAYRAGTGLLIDLDKIPTREKSMSGYELLLSESQERMLIVCNPEKLTKLKEIYSKWDLHAEDVGEVIEETVVRMSKNGEEIVCLPVSLVANPPLLERAVSAPSDLKQRWFFDRNKLLLGSLEKKFESLFRSPSFADPAPLIQQYDSQVGNRTVNDVYEDAAVLRLREIANKEISLALTVEGNPRVTWLDPLEGGRRAIAEAAVNLALKGTQAIGVTDCLNFASPENPEIMWQFSQAIEGISLACEALEIPVVSGNVSLYNETDSRPIHPSPMVGVVGIKEGKLKLRPSYFSSSQLEIGLVGPVEGGLGGSLLASQWFQRDCGQPEKTDLKLLKRTLHCIESLFSKRFEFCGHDISDGGLLLSVLEMALLSPLSSELGIELRIPQGVDVDSFLFGETVPRVILAYDSTESTEVERCAQQSGVMFTSIGLVNDSGFLEVKQGGASVLSQEISCLKKSWSNRWKKIFS